MTENEYLVAAFICIAPLIIAIIMMEKE